MNMLRRSDWIQDKRPMYGTRGIQVDKSWQEWVQAHYRLREDILMGVVDFLLKNQDWSGAYLIVRTYIATIKQKEGVTKGYNRGPGLESPHVRAVRLWFWSLVEKHGFAYDDPEEETKLDAYTDPPLVRRRKLEQEAAEVYPFVGGKPQRRYSEGVEFFQQLAEERGYLNERKGFADTEGEEA
jgi:hypothetical protein